MICFRDVPSSLSRIHVITMTKICMVSGSGGGFFLSLKPKQAAPMIAMSFVLIVFPCGCGPFICHGYHLNLSLEAPQQQRQGFRGKRLVRAPPQLLFMEGLILTGNYRISRRVRSLLHLFWSGPRTAEESQGRVEGRHRRCEKDRDLGEAGAAPSQTFTTCTRHYLV